MLIPTTPPIGRLEFLPSPLIAAAAIKLPDALQIQAWVPGFSMELADGKGSDDDDFFDSYCDDCEYHFDSYDLTPGECECLTVRGLPDCASEVVAVTVTSSCPCYADGLSAVQFPCAAGHDGPGFSEGGTYAGPPMLFSLTLKRSTGEAIATDAWSQAAYVRRTSNSSPLLCLSASDRSLNIHSSGEICWGSNDTPVDLFSLVEAYAISEFNDDLMSYNDFHAMRRRIFDDECRLVATCGDSATARRREFVDGIYAAMLVVDPSQHCYCFSLLLAMGAKPQSDGLLVLPLVWHDQRSEDVLISPPLDCGVSVLVRPGPSNAGLVIGQASCCNTYSPAPVPSLELAHA
jgi:hypothetical protein